MVSRRLPGLVCRVLRAVLPPVRVRPWIDQAHRARPWQQRICTRPLRPGRPRRRQPIHVAVLDLLRLAMTYGGAAAKRPCRSPRPCISSLPPEQLHSAFHRLIADLNHQNDSRSDPNTPRAVELLTANALWTQSGERILPEFQKLIEKQLRGRALPGRLPPRASRGVRLHQSLGRGTDQRKNQGPDQAEPRRLAHACSFSPTRSTSRRSGPARFPRRSHGPAISWHRLVKRFASTVMHLTGKFALRRRHHRAGTGAAVSGREALDGRRLAQGVRTGSAQLESSLSPAKARWLAEFAVPAPRRGEPSPFQAHGRVRAERRPLRAGHAGGVRRRRGRLFGNERLPRSRDLGRRAQGIRRGRGERDRSRGRHRGRDGQNFARDGVRRLSSAPIIPSCS